MFSVKPLRMKKAYSSIEGLETLAVYLKERRVTIVNENVESIQTSYHLWIYIFVDE